MSATREIWSKRVVRWKASGKTAAEFARKHGVSEASLKWWSWKLGAKRREATTPPKVSPLTFVEMTSAITRGGAAIEVVLESGAVVRVAADFDESALSRVLDVLERRR
jgi:hypothetical protein